MARAPSGNFTSTTDDHAGVCKDNRLTSICVPTRHPATSINAGPVTGSATVGAPSKNRAMAWLVSTRLNRLVTCFNSALVGVMVTSSAAVGYRCQNDSFPNAIGTPQNGFGVPSHAWYSANRSSRTEMSSTVPAQSSHPQQPYVALHEDDVRARRVLRVVEVEAVQAQRHRVPWVQRLDQLVRRPRRVQRIALAVRLVARIPEQQASARLEPLNLVGDGSQVRVRPAHIVHHPQPELVALVEEEVQLGEVEGLVGKPGIGHNVDDVVALVLESLYIAQRLLQPPVPAHVERVREERRPA
ncbi:hypothetical protein N7462_004630 [Penicillium macrosclerotiorum]|uniref:uncharacterized protein n=1 Tax=Penicillium macrosclerotiorum TaxID=303699 RepID=UPI0025466C8A|nr:uncharacterized protein N7462_004630 [Penicillium macrosclerotiorum]KAJ5690238.1 hypothetical protein N7462_004630 [Penicillium macrosclerotiorum]